MATYIIDEDILITRQEGDDADIVFTVPDVLSLNGATAKFQAYNTDGVKIIDKSIGSGIAIDGQKITIDLIPFDTLNKANVHRWELEITTSQNKVITIGRGSLKITKQLIK